jgi:hypothetical protein
MDNLFFFKEDVEREQKVEKKLLYILNKRKFFPPFPLSFFFSSLSLSSLKLIFFLYILTAVNTFFHPFVVFPLSLFPTPTVFFLSLSSPIFISYFFLQHWPTPKNVNFFFTSLYLSDL